MEIDFQKGGGLVPVVAQDALTGEVLMLAYMDEEAWNATRESGFMHYHSRSRGKLWKKGEESGHLQEVVALELDCDGDAVLAKVRQTGPACHTGRQTCFHNRAHGEGDVLLAEIGRVLAARHAGDADDGSYTAKLFADENKRLKKIAEEAGEVIMAVKDRDKAELAGELADLLFHSLVVAEAAGVAPRDVLGVLAERRGKRRA